MLPLVLTLFLAGAIASGGPGGEDASILIFNEGEGVNDCQNDSRRLTRQECEYFARKKDVTIKIERSASKPAGCYNPLSGNRYVFNKHKSGSGSDSAKLLCGADFRTYWGKRGKDCPNAAFEVDCRVEAKRQGVRFKAVTRDKYPPGCFEKGGQLFYNSYNDGVTSGHTATHKLARPLCFVYRRDAVATFPKAAECGLRFGGGQSLPMTEEGCAGYKHDGSYKGVVQKKKRPHGCFIDTKTKKVYFNERKGGAAHKRATLVCDSSKSLGWD